MAYNVGFKKAKEYFVVSESMRIFVTMIRKVTFFLLILIPFLNLGAQRTIDLSGEWDFGTNDQMTDKILLPGSMPERRKGNLPSVETRWTASLYDSSYFYNPYMEKYRRQENFKIPFFLTPARHYIGTAWYHRKVNLNNLDEKMRYSVMLERPHITVTLWMNGQEVGKRNSLSRPDEWDVTRFVRSGENDITLRIDNKIEDVGVGPDSHSVTDQTQGNWNGAVGRMELKEQPRIFMENIRILPNVATRSALSEICIKVFPDESLEKKLKKGIKVEYALNGTDGIGNAGSQTIHEDSTILTVPIEGLGERTHLWDEFDPFVYQLTTTLTSHWGTDTLTTQFGMREFRTDERMFSINGRRTMLRGTVENCNFPLTGYPLMDVESWKRIFRQCKAYGLNHMRFHSYCPPEAAFVAADQLGFYLQPEGPSWPNHGVRLGAGQVIDTYLMEETKRMVERYGNHPSFCMLSAGNEPAGNWVPWVSRFVDYWKEHDSRRIYTGASVGGSWAWQPKNEYHVKAGVRGLDEWRRQAPESTYDFRARLDTVRQPFVCHEAGQWCAFPDLEETRQYTGVYKATNFEIFRQLLNDHGMAEMSQRFLLASGKLQVLCYKNEIERILRTPDYAGYQLLGLNDYSGQGTALVGPLNVFFREKGYVTAEEWREFCGPITLLCRLPKFTYWNDENLSGFLEVSNFGRGEIENPNVVLSLLDGEKEIKRYEGVTSSFVIPLSEIKEPRKLTLRATLTGQSAGENVSSTNHWDVWVYPRENAAQAKTMPKGIHVCKQLDEAAMQVLNQGGKVLIEAAGQVTYGQGIVQHFLPVFWNTSWFKMRPPHTTGIYVWNNHPVFDLFPTDYHSDMQWWELMNNQQVMLFDRFPQDFQPLVQSIDTWFLSRKIGMLFEANVAGGRLMMTTFPLEQENYEAHPVIAQMRKSILSYMQSERFQPKYTLNVSLIQELFERETPPVNMFTKDMPDELKTKKKN